VVCSVLRQVIHQETGELFTIIQLDVKEPTMMILKGEDGQLISIPVDLVVCSTCKSRIYQMGLDVFLCESYLKDIYDRTGVTDIEDLVLEIYRTSKRGK